MIDKERLAQKCSTWNIVLSLSLIHICFLIAGSSVELPCPVHAADHFAFQRGVIKLIGDHHIFVALYLVDKMCIRDRG